jgi:hypothetical protein
LVSARGLAVTVDENTNMQPLCVAWLPHNVVAGFQEKDHPEKERRVRREIQVEALVLAIT